MVWATAVSVFYLLVSVFAGDGLDFTARDEKPLMVRIMVMYALVTIVNLVSRFERTRWRVAVEREKVAVDRERTLQRKRIEVSKSIHDTLAQSAYMIGMGLDTAKELTRNRTDELESTLEATSLLSKTLIWQMRQTIDMGRIFEGRDLGRTLRSHAATFTTITSIPVEINLSGSEPPLSTETRSLLFSIAHNALTNAFRHANAGKVLRKYGELDFGEEDMSVSISDNGVGLSDGYDERGHGLANMQKDTARLGGRLIIEPRGQTGGVSVFCVVPYGGIAGDGITCPQKLALR